MLYKKVRLSSILISFGMFSALALPAQAVVIASVKPVGFIAAAIADGVTSVEILLPDGASEHNYTLRPSDIKRLHNADLVTWVGPDIEIFMSKYALRLPLQKTIEIDNLPGIKPLLLNNYEMHMHEGDGKGHEYHYRSKYNMHLWMSPQIAKKTVIAIHAKLLELMPQKKEKLDANLLHFKAELSSANAKIGKQLSPMKDKGYFVFHDAYTYFEKHFGLRPLGYFTINPAIQPGAKRLHQIQIQLVKRKATCIFSEPQFRPSAIAAVSRGIAVRSGTLDPLGTNITLGKDSYVKFLLQLSNQYVSCLKEE